ncbi:MAG: hypothetical protein A3C43_10240 [Candidatus Schekmanbacteria bacterium RIFCSPHIGHO2_02_FULL_38_11]|nr:MAG: hypothetical protein A3C43_10240 [Candidatus Schekmanbacteria bacterium RIFCSPHIGHO2_02_FULL_38_11]
MVDTNSSQQRRIISGQGRIFFLGVYTKQAGYYLERLFPCAQASTFLILEILKGFSMKPEAPSMEFIFIKSLSKRSGNLSLSRLGIIGRR